MLGAKRLSNFLVLLAVIVAPVARGSEQPSAVRAMMDASGMVEQFGSIGEKFRNGVLQAGQPQQQLPAEHLQSLADLVGRAMDGGDLLNRIEAALGDALSPEQVQAVLSFYQSPLGARIKEAELNASRQAEHADLNAMAPAIRAELDKDPARLAVYREMDDALFATKITVTMLQGMMRAMFMGILEAQPNVGPEQREAALERLAKQSDAMVSKLQDRVIIGLARTYRDAPLTDLKEYLNFLRTDAARAASAVVFAEMSGFLEERGRRVGSEFSALLRQKRT